MLQENNDYTFIIGRPGHSAEYNELIRKPTLKAATIVTKFIKFLAQFLLFLGVAPTGRNGPVTSTTAGLPSTVIRSFVGRTLLTVGDAFLCRRVAASITAV